MHPILFKIPGLGFPIRSFGLMLALGFIVGSWLLGKLAARYGDDPKNDPARYAQITVWVLAGVVLGARTMYIIVEIARGSEVGHDFTSHPLEMLKIWNGGLVMYGGLFGAIAAGMMGARRLGIRAVHALDLGLVAGFVGQAIGRVGCLLVGDDFGQLVPPEHAQLPFPITLRVPNPLPEGSLFEPSQAGELLYATQTWMSLKALIVAFIGWQILKRRRYAGQVSLWMLVLYAILRSFVELYRGDLIRGVWFGGSVSTSQLVSLVSAAVCVSLLVKYRQRADPLPVHAPEPVCTSALHSKR